MSLSLEVTRTLQWLQRDWQFTFSANHLLADPGKKHRAKQLVKAAAVVDAYAPRAYGDDGAAGTLNVLSVLNLNVEF